MPTDTQLDPRTKLSLQLGNGFYIHRKAKPNDLYLTRDNRWEVNCINGWFLTQEQALAAYGKTKPKVPIFSLDLADELHWETRDA